MENGWLPAEYTPSTNGNVWGSGHLGQVLLQILSSFLTVHQKFRGKYSMMAWADGLAWTTASPRNEPLRSNPHLRHLRSRFQGGPTSWPEGPRRCDRKLSLGNAKHEKWSSWWWWWWWWSLSYLLGCKGWRWSIKCCKGHGLPSRFSFELYAWTATCQEKGVFVNHPGDRVNCHLSPSLPPGWRVSLGNCRTGSNFKNEG